MRKAIVIAVVAPWFVACGNSDLETPDFHALRGGKADTAVDTALSCQGFCGDLATSPTAYCGCDDACASYGDCCADKAAVCDAAPAAIAITKADDGATKKIDVGATIDVQLAGNPTTGYGWHLLASSRSFPLQKEEYVPDQPQLVGSGGTYHFFFTADSFAAGKSFQLDFAYYRSWEGPTAAIEKFRVTVVVLPAQATCQAIENDYAAALAKSKGCSADAECDAFAGGSLSCGIPHQAYNKTHNALIKSFGTKWQNAQCHLFPWVCPMLAPLPPWFEVHGVCEQGSCAVKYVDTRAAKEGDACGDDIGVSCGDGLYCAFGLNWCGTPPVTGVCRQMGDCGAPSDCLNEHNDWIHPACMGEATCTAGQCGWDCSAQPF